MILAAVDIGSNAIRLQVVRVIRENDLVSFKKLEYLRFPLRLGKDAFKNGKIEKATQVKFEKLMRTFRLLIELYETDAYMAVATSAMREAANGKELVNLFATYYNLKVDIISGRDEAEMLSKAIIPYLDERNYIHIDVGGGSTELNLYKNKVRVSSQSFKVGSVRKLSSKDRKEIFKAMSGWLKEHKSTLNETITAVGTGGNINKLLKLSRQKYNKGISLTELKALKAYVNEFDYDKRVNQLKMNPDRADVIVPAAEIYIEAMKLSGADQILVPGVGLKDGTLYALFEKTTGEHISNIEFLELF